MAPEAEAALGLSERDVELEDRDSGLARDAQQTSRVDLDTALDQRRAAQAEPVGRERLLVVDDENSGTVTWLTVPRP